MNFNYFVLLILLVLIFISLGNFIKIINVINRNRNYFREIQSYLIPEIHEEKDEQICLICKKKLFAYRRLMMCSHKFHL